MAGMLRFIQPAHAFNRTNGIACLCRCKTLII
jgi:hypothetical protein